MIVISYIMNQDLVDSKIQSLDLLPPKSQNQQNKVSYGMRAIDFARKFAFSSSVALFSLDTTRSEGMRNE